MINSGKNTKEDAAFDYYIHNILQTILIIFSVDTQNCTGINNKNQQTAPSIHDDRAVRARNPIPDDRTKWSSTVYCHSCYHHK